MRGLSSREFEKRFRVLHRAELERSPELRADYRRLRKAENSAVSRAVRHVLMPLFWNALFLSIALKAKDAAMTASVISLWAAGTAFRWGHRWFQQFYASEDLVVLNLLPLDDRQIFRFQTGRYLRAAGWTVWEFLLAYGVLGLVADGGAVPVFCLPLAALLQSALVLALALHVASRLHMLPLNGIAGLMYATAFTLLLLGSGESNAAQYIVQASQWFLPTGWLNYVLLTFRADAATLALLAPIAALIYLARFSWGRLRSFYSLEGFEIVASARPHAPHPEDDQELTADSFQRRVGPTEIEERVAARSFLEGVNWQEAGWLERFASRFLNARERVIAEFLVAQDPGWSRGFRWSFWVWLVACAVVFFLGRFGGTVVFFTAYVLVTACLPLFGGDWRGMRQAPAGGVFLPGFALYPIRFNAIARIFLKVNLIRMCAAVPFLVSFAALAAWSLGHGPALGASIGAKAIGVLFALQPLLVLLPISSTTNDTSRMRWIWALVFLPGLIGLVAGAVGVFFSSSGGGLAGSFASLLLISTLLFFVYRWAYRRGRFDLLSHRRQQDM